MSFIIVVNERLSQPEHFGPFEDENEAEEITDMMAMFSYVKTARVFHLKQVRREIADNGQAQLIMTAEL